MDMQNLEALVLKPSRIVWDDCFSVGVDMLDEHHQVMARLINRLADFIPQPDKLDVMAEIIEALGDYAIYHFIYEERLLKEHGFPGVAVHLREHQGFCRVIAHSKTLIRDGFADPIGLLDYLHGWWRSHILEHDMEYKDFLVCRGVA